METRREKAGGKETREIEARETRYWLLLLEKSNLTKIPIEDYIDEVNHIINILTKIVKTSMEKEKYLKDESAEF